MNKVLVAALLSMPFAVSYAAAEEVSGTVAEVKTFYEITLDDGSSYQVPAELAPDSIMAGQNVTVTFDAGSTLATAVLIDQAGENVQEGEPGVIVGSIIALDAEARTITLDNNQIFNVPEDIDIDTLEVGANISVNYEPDTMAVTAIELQ